MTASSSATVRAWRVVGGLAALAAVLFGLLVVVGTIAREDRTYRTEHPAGDVDTLDVDTGSGDVTVVADRAEGEPITVEMLVTETIFGSSHRARVEDGRLEVRAGCEAVWLVHCTVRIEVRVPRDVEVVVHSGNGEVRVRGLDGTTRLGTDNGGIVVDDVGGDVRVDTDNGDVVGVGLRVTSLVAATDNGQVDLAFTTPPSRVEARSDNGDLTLAVPPGEAYALTTETDNGSIDTPIRTDPDAPRRLDLSTDNGDITVRSGR